MASSKKIGEELEAIKDPQKVKVLILSESRATLKDFYLIKNFTRLIKIDLSYNKIASFPTGFTFKHFTSLRTLFLHFNKFVVIKHLLPVTECQTIQYLTLFGNPLEEAKARHFFVNEVPNLMLMDDKVVRLEERNPSFNLKEVPISPLSFPLTPQNQEESSKFYIQTLIRELTIIRQAYLNANPIIKIQRWWRHRAKNRLVKKTCTPLSEQSIQRQASIKDYKNDLDRLTTEKMEISKSNQELIVSIMRINSQFWSFMNSLMGESKIYLSREYCHIRGINYEQIQDLTFLRHHEDINPKLLRNKRNLHYFLTLHQRMIIKKEKHTDRKGKNVKEISLKMCELYKINRNRFMHNQQKLINKEAGYHHYVLPLESKEELAKIVKKEYFKALRGDNSYNRVPFFIQKLAMRSIAAVSIQRHWKGYKVRKSWNAFIRIKEKESAIKIQRWIRRLKFIHRHKFLLEVSQYLKKERNNEITLEMTQIEAIESYCTYKQTLGNNLMLLFQECSFSVLKDTDKPSIVFYAERKPYPKYINLTFQAKDNPSQAEKDKQKHKSCILDLLFREAKDINKITDSKGTKFIRFVYESIEEALDRKFILALKTYRMINHQFIRSKDTPNVPNHYVVNIISQMSQNKLVSLVYDYQSNRKEGTVEYLSKKLENSRSQSSLNTDIALISDTLCIKIKYFLVKKDLSCTIFIKEPQYPPHSKRTKDDKNLRLNLNLYYLGKKSLSKRYEEENSGEVLSKISRNIMSLNDFEGLPTNMRKATERKESAIYHKILSTDQSHSIINSLSPKSSYNKFQSYRKNDSFDRFDKEVYPAEGVRDSLRYEQQLGKTDALREKKERIEQIKSAHKKNISYISSQKTQNLTNLRRSIIKENEEAIKKIDEARNMLQQQKVRKHDRIKEHFKSVPTNFEKEFLKKGIRSIKKEFKEYEKHRSVRESLQNITTNHPSHSKINALKTQMKEFSINFSEADTGPRFSELSIDFRGKNLPKMCELPKKLIDNYDSNLPSRTSEKSEPANNQSPEIEQQDTKINDQQRKKLRKKRLVHSVFPQEFYPIRQANQIGFELPKIVKK